MTSEAQYCLTGEVEGLPVPSPVQAFSVELPPAGAKLRVVPGNPEQLLAAQILCNRLGAVQRGVPIMPDLRLKLEAAAARLEDSAPPDPTRFPGVQLAAGELDLFLENLRVGAQLLYASLRRPSPK